MEILTRTILAIPLLVALLALYGQGTRLGSSAPAPPVPSVLPAYAAASSAAYAVAYSPVPAPEAEGPPSRVSRWVATGQPWVVHAAWWGFNAADATSALQSAIASGAQQVVVDAMVDRMGAQQPWIVGPITLASNQELVFAAGVRVQAKRGAFLGLHDCLFTARNVTGLTLRGLGTGATLQMWKEDYTGGGTYPSPPGQWRHLVQLLSCSSVRISGLTLANSGGDGIYLGTDSQDLPNRDITISHVICTDNYRQGISVVSADSLAIRSCLLENTGTQSPSAGLDFEPNNPSEQLTQCTLSEVTCRNNHGAGVALGLLYLNDSSKPVDITLDRCTMTGNLHATWLCNGNPIGVAGSVRYQNCTFAGAGYPQVVILGKPANAFSLEFTGCRIEAPSAPSGKAPILFESMVKSTLAQGGTAFGSMTVLDPSCVRLFDYIDQLKTLPPLAKVTGTLVLPGNPRQVRVQVP